MKVSVVILNWNTRDYLQSFLDPVIRSCEGFGQTIVADSASTDGSVRMLTEKYPDLKIIPLESNYGFTGGYNRALKDLDSEYYLLLNSDIEVSPGWLKPLVDWMDAHPECAVCGPKLHGLAVDPEGKYRRSENFEYAGAAGGFVDRFGYPYCRGRVLKRVDSDRGQFDEPREVMWISGACMMVRRSVWEELGGLDDNFFAHMEEIDFCWRAVLLGWTVVCVPQSVVYHLGGGTLAPDSPYKLKLNFRNNLLMLRKNLPATVGNGWCSIILLTRMLLDGASALVYLLTFKPSYFKAVIDAHNEFRKIRGKCRVSSSCGHISGIWLDMMKIWILPISFMKGADVFKTLKYYEDNHRRSR